MKKTPWFPTSIRPLRTGEYEVFRPIMKGTCFFRCRMLWTGEDWRYPHGGYSDFGRPYPTEEGDKWRGLVKGVT
jgi:hypothetical protein